MFRLSGVFRAVRKTVCSGAEVMPKVKFYYAVRKGFKPGVYKTWDECKVQVEKFPAASFKKFASEKEAWAFFRGAQSSAAPAVDSASQSSSQSTSSLALLPKRGPEPLQYIALGPKRSRSDEDSETSTKRPKQETPTQSCDGFTYMGFTNPSRPDEGCVVPLSSDSSVSGYIMPCVCEGDSVVVYTDGCCTRNGKSSARAGIGVYWGPHHPLNVAERLDGRQTNQRAELQAACRALELARENNIEKLVLYTDSKFTINGVTTWVKNWKLNGWRLKSGGNITNKDDFMKLDQLNSELQVTWLHIPGHAGYHGNEEADRLSREGASKPAQQSDSD